MPSSTLAVWGGKKAAVPLRDSSLFGSLPGETPRPVGAVPAFFAQNRISLRGGVKPRLAGLTLFLLGGLVARAATYYVSPAGNDGNTGSQGSPFRQIRDAISSSHPRDTAPCADRNFPRVDLDGMAG